jgi:hypothetical protein
VEYFSGTGSLVSVTLGFMLYYTGEYTGAIVEQHIWGGVLFTSCLSVSLYLFLSHYKSVSKLTYRSFFASLLMANLVVGYTSHQGGSLTHGSEYLTEYMPAVFLPEETWQPKPVEEMLVYEDVIEPILDRKCMSCHNENKAKGDLIMTSLEALKKGGKSDQPSLTPGSSAESDMYRRVTLPLKHDDRMPPEGKVSMTEDEIALLSWWIDSGADAQIKVQTAAADKEIQPLLQRFLAALESMQRTAHIHQQSTEKLIQTVSKENYVLEIDPFNEQGIQLSMSFPPAIFGDGDLLDVEPVFDRITKASFIGSDITDDAFYHIGQMSSLQALYLQQTQIKGTGLVHLSKLNELSLIDLSQSEINNAQLLNVLYLPSLKDVYINEVDISPDILKALKENKPELTIHLERGKMF